MSQQLADLVQRYYDCFNRRDFAAYARLFTPDCLIECPGVQLHGIEGAIGFDQVWIGAMPDAKITSHRKATAAGIVMCENNIKGTHTGSLNLPSGSLPPTNKTFDKPYMAAFELEGERIKRQTLHFDSAALMMELGPADNRANNAAIAKGVYEAFNRHDIDYILSNCDEHVTWGVESVATEVKAFEIFEGRQNVAKFFQAWGETADFHSFGAHDFVAVGEQVFCTLSFELTVKATGKRLVVTDAPQRWTFKDGKIVRWRGYQDTAAARDAFRK